MWSKKKLAEAGFDLKWLETKRAEQNGVCDRCGNLEPRKKPTGERKNLIFNPQRRAFICSTCSTTKSRQKTTALKKAESVAAEKARRAAEPQTANDFWMRNRAALTSEEREQLEGREYDVMLLADALVEFIQADADGTP